jgi:hypothetical protein
MVCLARNNYRVSAMLRSSFGDVTKNLLVDDGESA